jgi:heme exporter protein D
MPDLGTYAGAVLAAYGASIVLLGGLTAWVMLRARRIARALAAVERGQERG